jgi:hypothetical protein
LLLVTVVNFVGCNTAQPSPIAYDQNLKNAIVNRWYELLDKDKFAAPEKSGATVVAFHLYPDGKIDALKVVTNTAPVSEHLALRAVKDCAPFPEWPDVMKQMVSTNYYREITFTFNYYGKLDSIKPNKTSD